MKNINEITAKELKDGKRFFFSNEVHQESIQGDDVRIAEVRFVDSKHSWATGFKIESNGAIIGSFKTFPAMIKRLEKLAKDWTLTPIEEPEFS